MWAKGWRKKSIKDAVLAFQWRHGAVLKYPCLQSESICWLIVSSRKSAIFLVLKCWSWSNVRQVLCFQIVLFLILVALWVLYWNQSIKKSCLFLRWFLQLQEFLSLQFQWEELSLPQKWAARMFFLKNNQDKAISAKWSRTCVKFFMWL